MRKQNFRPWEIALMVLSLLLFLAGGGLYLYDYPLWTMFVGVSLRESRAPIGTVAEKEGAVRRKLLGASDFQSLPTKAPLYEEDTVVTGPGASAHLELDGAQIDLGPDAMVRLAFEAKLSLGGISRVPQVEVVTGKVTGRSVEKAVVIKAQGQSVKIAKGATEVLQAPPKPVEAVAQVWVPKVTVIQPSPKPLPVAEATPTPEPLPPPLPVVEIWPSPSPPPPAPMAQVEPSPSPEPSMAPPAEPPPPPPPPVPLIKSVRWVGPARGAVLPIDKASREPRRAVKFEWAIQPGDAETMFRVRKAGESDWELEKRVLARGGRAAVPWTVTKPGEYEWELKGKDGEELPAPVKGAFRVPAEFEAIETLPPLVAGQTLESNRLRQRVMDKFELALRWQPFPGVDDYEVLVYRDEGKSSPVFQKKLSETSVILTKDRVFTGQMFFRVRAELENGFIVSSGLQPFLFNFLAPVLTVPTDGATVTAPEGQAAASVLLTWQKTNFTRQYELEVARDAEFRQSVTKVKRPENFFMLRELGEGTYYWRVRSLADKLESPMSEASRFAVQVKKPAVVPQQ